MCDRCALERARKRSAVDQLHREVRPPITRCPVRAPARSPGCCKLAADLRFLDEAVDDISVVAIAILKHLRARSRPRSTSRASSTTPIRREQSRLGPGTRGQAALAESTAISPLVCTIGASSSAARGKSRWEDGPSCGQGRSTSLALGAGELIDVRIGPSGRDGPGGELSPAARCMTFRQGVEARRSRGLLARSNARGRRVGPPRALGQVRLEHPRERGTPTGRAVITIKHLMSFSADDPSSRRRLTAASPGSTACERRRENGPGGPRFR